LSSLETLVSPYLQDWHQAFAALDPGDCVPFELWFDRGPYPPMVERVRIPRVPTARGRQAVVRHLSVLINNMLCVHGARKVSIVSGEAELPLKILAGVQADLFQRVDSFSDMSLLFLHALMEGIFQTGFTMDTDRSHAAILRRELSEQPPPPRGRSGQEMWQGTALALNIGQRLTSWGLVEFNGRGQFGVRRFTRLDTTPAGPERSFASVFESLLAGIGHDLGDRIRDIEAVGISIAGTVVSGKLQPVREFGLFAGCAPDGLSGLDERLRRICQAHFPDRPVTLINDGEAQAQFAFHYAGGRQASAGTVSNVSSGQAGPEKHLLSLRLGACPCIHVLDAEGQSPPGVHEYSWLITSFGQKASSDIPCRAIRFPLSFYGVAAIAHELGLLEKYQVDPLEAMFVFPEMLLSDDPAQRNDAESVYRLLGAHVAMLACEIHRHRPLGAITLLGSRANHIDPTVFPLMREGFSAFIAGHARHLGGIAFILVQDASSRAGIVGAAHVALRRDMVSGP
jgi:hypothetical protein